MEWKHPFTAIVTGATGCGKTQFTKRFLGNITSMVNVVFDRKIVYYGEWQSGYLEFSKDFDVHDGVPQSEDFAGDKRPNLVIIDELMRECLNSSIVDLFKKGKK